MVFPIGNPIGLHEGDTSSMGKSSTESYNRLSQNTGTLKKTQSQHHIPS